MYKLPFDPHWFLRIAMAAVFLYHGLTKNVKGFSESFGFPLIIGALVIFAEVAGGAGFIAGGFTKDKYFGLTVTQWSALAVIPVILGGIALVHWKNGFNIMDNGWEYLFVLLMIAYYFMFESH